MKHNRYVFSFVLLFSFAGIGSAVAQQTLRVCTYNDPPLTSVDKSGHFQGIYIDILNAIAHREHWKLTYLSRDWNTCLQSLNNHSVDLLTGIAYTPQRAKQYSFNKKNVLVDWGQIYLPEHSPIHSLMELNGKRIATVRQGILFGAFRDLLTRFGLKCTFVFESSPQKVFEALEKNEADAGTVLRLDGLRLQDQYRVKSSPIVFAPLQLRFAAPLGSNQSILDAIDANLTSMKADQGSAYYESMDHWLQSPGGFWELPAWLWWVILGSAGLAVLFIGISVLLRWQVRRRTIDLNTRNVQLNREIAEREETEKALRRSEQLLRADIAERKRAEEENQKLQAQLLQAQRMESVGHLAGGVAHDFNNMLGVILGHTELSLRRIPPEEPLRASLEEIRNATQRSAMLTQQLLAFARQQAIVPRVLDLNKTIEGMLKMLRRLIGEDIDLAWHPVSELWPVKVDPTQIDQIFANLCVNARDAIEGVGKVTIETENTSFDEEYCRTHAGFATGEFVMLAVSDNGHGMDKETLGKIFDPFFTTKELGKGTGLGLSTVYGIVKQNNGFINVYSEASIGTTFKIYLPRHTGSVQQVRSDELKEQIPRGKETILVVEDESALLELSKTALEMQGYHVLPAASPSQAIRVAEEYDGEIHLLMTDVIMPEMNGMELAEKLLSLYPGLERLFTSGYTSNAIFQHVVVQDGMHFIPKPFSPHDLAAKVREVLDHRDGER